MFAPKQPVDQELHWNTVYRANAAFFGDEPSAFAQKMLGVFRQNGVNTLLELGAGQGRDTLFFAHNGLSVVALDYATQSVNALQTKAANLGLGERITAYRHDARTPMLLPDASVDAVYAHMLLCMYLEWHEILFVLQDVRRVLRPGGLCVWSVRTFFDPHYAAGRHIKEQMYEVGGFIIHFFNEDMIRQCTPGYTVQSIERMEDGALPRDLFVVIMQKADV